MQPEPPVAQSASRTQHRASNDPVAQVEEAAAAARVWFLTSSTFDCRIPVGLQIASGSEKATYPLTLPNNGICSFDPSTWLRSCKPLIDNTGEYRTTKGLGFPHCLRTYTRCV